MKDYKYKFSVIIPVYNVEVFLDETINSIINQTIGFEENIQLVLVNDGSSDKSEETCLHYKEMFPENIVYVYKENGGVSSARNEGIKHINGKYVNFFDGDDKWKNDAFEIAYDYFEENYDEIDFVSCRYCYFDSREGFLHPLDYKFGCRQIIDIAEEYSFIQLSVATAFIKAEALGDMMFDERLDYSEDSKFMLELVLDKGKYGILPEVIYYYRKREEQSSALDTRFYNKPWYADTIKYCYREMLDMSVAKYGKVIPYVQYQVMYDMKQRIPRRNLDILSSREFDEYKKLIIDILQSIDDFIILKQKKFSLENKLFVLYLKNGDIIYEKLDIKNGVLTYSDMSLAVLKKRQKLHINEIKTKFGRLVIKGYHDLECLGKDFNVSVVDENDVDIPIKSLEMPEGDKYAFDGTKTLRMRGFEVCVKVKKNKKLKFILKHSEANAMHLKPKYEENLKGLENEGTFVFKRYDVREKSRELFITKRPIKKRIRSMLSKYRCFK